MCGDNSIDWCHLGFPNLDINIVMNTQYSKQRRGTFDLTRRRFKAGTSSEYCICNHQYQYVYKNGGMLLKLLVAQYATVATAHRAKSLQGQLGSSRQEIVYQEASVARAAACE